MSSTGRQQGELSRFPDPANALEEPNGLLAVGGRLDVDDVIDAYGKGIFPWFQPDEPVLWWSPDPRAVLLPRELHISRRTQRLRRSIPALEYRLDGDFAAVLDGCASVDGRAGNSWIGPAMRRLYRQLHERAVAHSFEAWIDGQLAGGVLVLQFGAYVSGESMFRSQDHGSKLALIELAARLRQDRHALLDCQMQLPHLQALGTRQLARRDYLRLMRAAQQRPGIDLGQPASD